MLTSEVVSLPLCACYGMSCSHMYMHMHACTNEEKGIHGILLFTCIVKCSRISTRTLSLGKPGSEQAPRPQKISTSLWLTRFC